MQFNNTNSKTNLKQYNAEKKEETNVLNDQRNIREIIEKHPYKKWEDILDGNK